MFDQVPTNKVVGLLLGNDIEGNIFSDPVKGFPPIFEARGYKVVDPGRFQLNTNDFSAQIAAFKKANAEILYGNMPLPTFSNFWAQAAQQGYKPKIVVIGKATAVSVGRRSAGPAREVPVDARFGGRPLIRSSPVSRVRARRNFATRTKRSPRSNGRRRSVSAMPCSRSRSTFSSGRRTRIRRRRLLRRSAPPSSTRS